jgi:hypothetical protein
MVPPDNGLTPIESALADLWADIIEAELTADPETKRPEHLASVAGRDVHEGEVRERRESITKSAR